MLPNSDAMLLHNHHQQEPLGLTCSQPVTQAGWGWWLCPYSLCLLCLCLLGSAEEGVPTRRGVPLHPCRSPGCPALLSGLSSRWLPGWRADIVPMASIRRLHTRSQPHVCVWFRVKPFGSIAACRQVIPTLPSLNLDLVLTACLAVLCSTCLSTGSTPTGG